MVNLLTNPLATPAQLLKSTDALPPALLRSLHYLPTTLLIATGQLLRLPQPTIATACVLLHRFQLVVNPTTHPLLPTVQAALYLATKLTEQPRRPRGIINATSYILNTAGASPVSPREQGDRYVSESEYFGQREEMLALETVILKSQGFQTHVALPYSLLINYLRTLDCLEKKITRRAWCLINDGLLAPERIYLTHQPNAIAVAAVYIAAREGGKRLPESWWEVFDVDREELGFLVVSLLGVAEFCRGEEERWRRKGEKGEVPWGEEGLRAVVEGWVEEMEES